jgi:hypothetical protein
MFASPVREQTVERRCYRDPHFIATFSESALNEVEVRVMIEASMDSSPLG